MTAPGSITSGDLERAAALSPLQRRFLERVAEDPRWLDPASFATLQEPSPLYNTVQAAWPLFVSRAFSARLAADVRALVTLFEAAVLRRARGEVPPTPSVLARFPRQLAIAARRGPGIANVLRADLLETEEGFRCVELNVTAALGGWQNGFLEGRLRECPVAAELLDGEAAGAKLLDPFRAACKTFAARARERGGAVVFTAPADITPMLREMGEMMLRTTFEELDPALDTSRIHLVPCGDLTLVDDRIVAPAAAGPIAVAVDLEYPADEREEMMRLCEDDRVLSFRGVLSNLLSDKRCLAWLSEDAARGIGMSDAEAASVATLLPETRIVAAGDTLFGGRRVEMEDLLANAKDELVLKPADELAGRGVCVGATATPSEWDATVRKALAEDRYVVQRRVVSVTRPMWDPGGGCSPHAVVWGVFLLEHEGRGISGRTMAASKGSVINVARGGQTALIFEV